MVVDILLLISLIWDFNIGYPKQVIDAGVVVFSNTNERFEWYFCCM